MLKNLVKSKEIKHEGLGKEYIRNFLSCAMEDAFCYGDEDDVKKYIALYEGIDNWYPMLRSKDETDNFVRQVKRVLEGL